MPALFQILVCTALPASLADFTFTLNIVSHTTTASCDVTFRSCETYFPIFCLRDRRERDIPNTNDCPLGKSTKTLEVGTQRGTRTIFSRQTWEGGFQLYIQAWDDDGIFSDADHIGNLFVNLDLAANSGLTSRATYYGDGFSMVMTFRVDCREHFYSPNCSVYCRPQENDRNGHYTCNSRSGSRVCRLHYYGSQCQSFCRSTEYYTCDSRDGSLICRRGFTNPGNLCQDNIDDCANFPCKNGGTCLDLIGNYSCTCAPGYTGRNCAVDVNECLGTECPGNSTCREGTPGTFECICNEGFEGELCTEINECADDLLCEHGGNCTDLIADYSCACASGYTGKNCSVDVDECLDAECPGNSTCSEGTPGTFECTCSLGFEGHNCTEIDLCESSPCENGATCESTDPFNFSCACLPGFSGTRCEEVAVVKCDEDACHDGFKCLEMQKGILCTPTNYGNSTEEIVPQRTIILVVTGLGALLLAFISLLLGVLVCSKKKVKNLKAERRLERHFYENSLHSKVSLSSLQKIVRETSPVYSLPTTFIPTAKVVSASKLITSEKAEWNGNKTKEEVIYEEVRLEPTANADPSMVNNVAYVHFNNEKKCTHDRSIPAVSPCASHIYADIENLHVSH